MGNLQIAEALGEGTFCSSWTWLGSGLLCLWSSCNQLFHVLGLIQWNVAGKWQNSKQSSGSRGHKICLCHVCQGSMSLKATNKPAAPWDKRCAAQESYSSGTAGALVTSRVPKWGHGQFWGLFKDWAYALYRAYPKWILWLENTWLGM